MKITVAAAIASLTLVMKITVAASIASLRLATLDLVYGTGNFPVTVCSN